MRVVAFLLMATFVYGQEKSKEATAVAKVAVPKEVQERYQTDLIKLLRLRSQIQDLEKQFEAARGDLSTFLSKQSADLCGEQRVLTEQPDGKLACEPLKK